MPLTRAKIPRKRVNVSPYSRPSAIKDERDRRNLPHTPEFTPEYSDDNDNQDDDDDYEEIEEMEDVQQKKNREKISKVHEVLKPTREDLMDKSNREVKSLVDMFKRIADPQHERAAQNVALLMYGLWRYLVSEQLVQGLRSMSLTLTYPSKMFATLFFV
jgi:hypothetical protein